jgi:class 3 adenylate cyclase/tetratricopeptide (TPR) repeat protein
VTVCTVCGQENPEGFRFCGACASPLATGEAGQREERKVVTALFCDLVGFTSLSESADPEDVNTMLDAYSATVRAQIENHGGVVQKFIGDAVVGVFGVPAAHEDDPERAVRAGLRIVEAAEELEAVGGAPLRLRVGINTGEALVRLDVNPGSGEGFLTGDAINTASRLQGVAPEMGVAVGVATYEATSVVFDYRELESAALKGKADTVRVYQPLAPRARFGTDLTRAHTSPFVGREVDLALLKGIFDKTVASESVQLVTVVGEPGLGKSRIVAELFGYIDARRELVTWRQGRCLPYGEGITFWALGEIVKAHAGILESDDPATATAKLDIVLPEGEERAWFRQRLLPLLGIEASSSAEREELFTAWRRWLELIAEADPTVLVFEDLHWADDAMLAFLEHLADRAEGVPLMIVGTTRPELYEQHADFGNGLRNTTAISLAPLSPKETARLVSALLDSSVIPAELQQPILERAGGNPLYAEEFVRLVKDKDLLVRRGSSWELRAGAEVPFPDSVRALIAARLDTLTPDAKSLLADAAVIGKVFWVGAVAQMGGRSPDEVAEVLRELSRKELIRASRRSSMQGEAEYAFWHILSRDVAYSQLPRASRASRHVAAAAWIEAQAPGRVEDLADVLAYHYATALELARAAGQADQAATLEEPARRFLTLAGGRALGLDTTAALTNLERALALTPEGHADRAHVLVSFAEAVLHGGRTGEARAALEEAIPALQVLGDLQAQARAMNMLGVVLLAVADPRWAELPAQAFALLEPLPPDGDLVAALTEVAAAEMLQGRSESAFTVARRALSLAEEHGLDRPPRALGYLGSSRMDIGDPAGADDMREAILLANQAGQGREVAVLHNNLSAGLWAFEGPQAALTELDTGVAYATARGLTEMAEWATTSTLSPRFDTGEPDAAITLAGDLTQRFQSDQATLVEVRSVEARIHTLRGQPALAAEFLEWLETTARDTAAAEILVVGLGSAAITHAALGDVTHAIRLLSELAATPDIRDNSMYAAYLPALVRTALRLGEPEIAHSLGKDYQPRTPYAHHALITADAALSEDRGDHQAAADGYADAAGRWERFGVVPEHAYALQGHGRCLISLGQPHEAAPALHEARVLFDRLGAIPALAETDDLLARATALSS